MVVTYDNWSDAVCYAILATDDKLREWAYIERVKYLVKHGSFHGAHGPYDDSPEHPFPWIPAPRGGLLVYTRYSFTTTKTPCPIFYFRFWLKNWFFKHCVARQWVVRNSSWTECRLWTWRVFLLFDPISNSFWDYWLFCWGLIPGAPKT